MITPSANLPANADAAIMLLRKIRRLIVFFIIMLALSGITAFPVEMELQWLLQFKNNIPVQMQEWLTKVYEAIKDTNNKYPFLLYGYDWLAFAHLVIASAFFGPYRQPVKNIWVIEWGMIACIGVLPLAFIAGSARGIPVFWKWIDCSFGLLGIIPLYICRKWIKQLEMLHTMRCNIGSNAAASTSVQECDPARSDGGAATNDEN